MVKLVNKLNFPHNFDDDSSSIPKLDSSYVKYKWSQINSFLKTIDLTMSVISLSIY